MYLRAWPVARFIQLSLDALYGRRLSKYLSFQAAATTADEDDADAEALLRYPFIHQQADLVLLAS